MVKVYSNCEEVELFLNGKSCGIKKRNGKAFPAAGLRWMLSFNEGKNKIHIIAKKGNEKSENEITFQYQTKKLGKPAKFSLNEIDDEKGISTIEVMVIDSMNLPCLDGNNFIRFGITGEGQMIDN